jgi:hypothetical protein
LIFKPALPGWLFTDQGKVTFKFLGQCTVTYHNPRRADTFTGDVRITMIVLHDNRGERVELIGNIIDAPLAESVRAGEVACIDLHLE